MIQRFHCLSPRLGGRVHSWANPTRKQNNTAWTWTQWTTEDFKIQEIMGLNTSQPGAGPFRHRLGSTLHVYKGRGWMGGGKCVSHRVVPETLDTPKGVWGKIHREKKTKNKALTLSKGLQESKVKAQVSSLAL